MTKNEEYKKLREDIRQLERLLGALGKSEASCCGVTMAQCHAIVEIGRAGKISLIELSGILGLDKSTMSKTVNGLVEDEIATRELNSSDRRYVDIMLTESGQKIFEGIEETMNIYYRKVFQSIPDDKKDQVLESLVILVEAINERECCV